MDTLEEWNQEGQKQNPHYPKSFSFDKASKINLVL